MDDLLKLTLTVELADGRVLSGRYHYLEAWQREKIALQDPNCIRVEVK